MNERNTLVYKTILERGTHSLRDRWKDIYSGRGLLLVSYLLPGARGCKRLHHPPCKPYLQRRPNPLIAACPLARLSILCTQSKSDRVVITWSPSSCTPVGPDYPDALSSPCLLITTWQLVKAHGVTRNESKIHVIFYITLLRHWSLLKR